MSLSSFIFKKLGWEAQMYANPIPKKYIVVVIPHTSNWDFFLGVLSRNILKQDIKFIGKSSLFIWPIGVFFRWMGGYPVDRKKTTNFVDSVIDIFNKKDEFIISISPEGTRKKVTKLKTGFYYIAKGAGIPMLLCRLNYTDKIISYSEPFYATADKEADFKFIEDYFRGIKGKNPENSYL